MAKFRILLLASKHRQNIYTFTKTNIMKKNLKDCTIALLGGLETSEFLDLLDIAPDQPYPKGIGGSVIKLLARELHSRGYNILLVSEEPDIKENVTLTGDRLKICFVPCQQKPARDFFRKESRAMAKVLIEEQPDFIHAHWTYEFALAALATDIPCLVTAHDAPLNVLKLNFIPFRMARTIMAYVAIWKTKHLSAVAPYVAQHLRKYLFYRRPITVIPNGMPDSLYNHVKPETAGSNNITFATILPGWSGRKNGEAAIQAFNLLLQTYPDARLIMFGYGHGVEEEASIWAKAQGISQNIEFAGGTPYSKLLERLGNEVDILVHPALEEAQPMSLIEAMSLKIPVIAGKFSGGVPWTLNDGKAGILVDVTKPEEICQAMLELANDESWRKQLGQTGYEYAKHKFHISIVVDAYLDTYEKILNEPN